MLGLVGFVVARPKLTAGLMVAAILLAFLAAFYLHGVQRGAQGVREGVARQDDRARGAGLDAFHEAEQCDALGGEWIARTGRCDTGAL